MLICSKVMNAMDKKVELRRRNWEGRVGVLCSWSGYSSLRR